MSKKTYKVIALSVGGSSNKVFHSGDIVEEGNFPPGNAEALVKNGFLEPADSKEEAKAEKTLIDHTTAKDLKEILDKAGVEYAKNASKADLFALVVGEFKIDEATATKDDLLALLNA